MTLESKGVLKSKGECGIKAPEWFQDYAEHWPNAQFVESGIQLVVKR